jgi:hypothetical protein
MKYNAIVVDAGLAFKKDFLMENMTYGAIYQNENWDPDDASSEELIEDQTSPVFRTYIITEKTQLDEVFSVFPDIDFEKEMIVMYAYTSVYGRKRIITSITLDNKNLKIAFKIAEGKPGYNDASMPQRRFLIIKLDKLDIDTVEFNLLR